VKTHRQIQNHHRSRKQRLFIESQHDSSKKV
jgi:hypothetical protein